MEPSPLREQALAAYAMGSEGVVALVERLVAGFGELFGGVTARLSAVEPPPGRAAGRRGVGADASGVRMPPSLRRR